MLNKIDHIGVAVHSLKDVKQLFYDTFGLQPVFEETVAEQKVKVAGFKIGESKIEFLEPTDEDSPIAKYLKTRGEGLHHIAVDVTDIRDLLSNMKKKAIRLIDEEPKTGAEGKLIAFAHPKSMHGILMELSQKEK